MLHDPLDPFNFRDVATLEPAAPTPQAADAQASAEEPERNTERDIQRGALRDLIKLAADSSVTESEIERDNRAATEKARVAFSDKSLEIEERYKNLKAEATAKGQAKAKQALAQHAAEKAKHTAADKAARQAAEEEKKSLDDKLKKKLGQAVWLADSVYDLATGQAAGAYKQKTGEIAAAQESLNELEVQAAGLVQRYGVALPKDDVVVDPDPLIETDADAAFTKHKESLEAAIKSLGRLPIANLFAGPWPFIIPILLAVGMAALGQFTSGHPFSDPQWKPIGIFGGSTFAVVLIAGFVFRTMATNQVRAAHLPVRKELLLAHKAAEQQLTNAAKKREADLAAATAARTAEVSAAKAQATPHQQKAAKARDTALATAQAELAKNLAEAEKKRDAARAEAEEWSRRTLHDLEHKHQREIKDNRARNEAFMAEIASTYNARKAALETTWNGGLAQIQAPIDRDGQQSIEALDWSDPAWKDWKPSKKYATRVRFGEMHVDLKSITDRIPQKLEIPGQFSLPAWLAFPGQGSLLIDTDHAGRADALATLQMVMTRLLTTLPAGRVRFTIIDPVSLGQNFAGFMHLAEYDDQLVSGRIWTSQDQIDEKLKNLAEHMETVIQKYLRNEFETIDAYNAQAGELAEPYRYLVIADLPVNFTTEAFKRLNSIAASGARCGVYTLIARDTRLPLPQGADLEQIKAHSVYLVREGEKFVWQDEVFKTLPLQLDRPATDDQLTELLHKVGVGAKEAKRVEVPFEVIAPGPGELWTHSTASEVDVMVGRQGANRFQSLKLGRGTSQHVMIAGKTGSGKSTLMHAMITNAALWYSPDEIELYLVDFKKGVEFKTYATNILPHARAIAVESDREFGLSLLTRLDVELARRGELFRKAAVQDLASYRKVAGAETLPRTLLIIDEYQEFFTEDDRLAQDATLLIERLVRQGRAFGMHVILGSQTAGGLPRGVLEQFAVRIALQTSEAGSHLILGDNNSAGRLLTRPGEAIYNDGGGLVESNSPFQVAYLSDAKRDIYLKDLASKAEPYFKKFGYPIVFEGNASAEIRRNPKLMNALEAPTYGRLTSGGAFGWLGDPVAIKDPTAIQFRRQAGLNVLIVGQSDEQSMALMNAMMVGLATQQGPSQAKFYVMDGTAADSEIAGSFEKVKAAIPNDVNIVDFRKTDEAIDEIAQEVARRQESDETGAPSIYLFVCGLQRYRVLRKQEDEFSFSVSDEPKKANPGKQFIDILREGPPLGVHVIVWSDTMVSIDRTLDRGTMREFDNRILFQMSAADSSNLIDSPAANKLGYHRAMVYSEEQGVMERFRPYALADAEWLRLVHEKLSAKVGATAGV